MTKPKNKQKNRNADPVQLANPFRAQHNELVIEANNPVERKPRHRVSNQRVIDKMVIAGHITKDEWSAAELLYKLAYATGVIGGLESQLSRVVKVDGSPGENLSFKMDAGAELSKYMKGIERMLGKPAAELTRLVCIEDCSCSAEGKRLKIVKPISTLKASLEVILTSR